MSDKDLSNWFKIDEEKDKRRREAHAKEYAKVQDAERRQQSENRKNEERMRLKAREKEISEEKQGVGKLGQAPVGRRRILS